MHEKRLLKRRHLLYNLLVINADTSETLGRLADINVEGLLLVSEKPVPVNADYTLRITLPQKILGQEVLQVAARSLWSKKDANPSLLLTGFRLDNPSVRDIEAIVGLIFSLGSPE
ncbi:MAG: PilZ domain-containing protein [Fibrobacterota bacterium]